MIKVQYQDGSIQSFEWEDAEAKHAFWHSSSHLMAEALQELYPGIQFGIGPAIENGFYYDVMPAIRARSTRKTLLSCRGR